LPGSTQGCHDNDGMSPDRTVNDAVIDFEPIGLKDHPGIGAGRTVEAGLGQIDSHPFGLGRQPEQSEPRGRPIGDKSRSLARIGQRDRGADFTIQEGRAKYLRRKSEVAGADIERRTIAFESGTRFVAMDHNPEWEARGGPRPRGKNRGKGGPATRPTPPMLRSRSRLRRTTALSSRSATPR